MKKYSTICNEFDLIVEDNPWQCINKYLSPPHVGETGGVLIGYHTIDESTAIVTEVLGPPKDSRYGTNYFHRGIAGLEDIFASRWIQRRRTHYLGEWHYRPALTVDLNDGDLQQMRIINSDQNYQCPEPIKIIVGDAKNGGRPVRIFVFPHGRIHQEFSVFEKRGLK